MNRLLPDNVPEMDIPEKIGPAKISEYKPTRIIGAAPGFVSLYDGVINPYSGCSFGCDYCYASNFTRTEQEKRDWGRWVKVKTNALEKLAILLPGMLNGRTYYMSTVTDPYQPVERRTKLTRGILEILVRDHPEVKLVVQTRSPLVVRDTDLLQEIGERNGRVQVNMTITTDDEQARKAHEPGCPSIPARIKAIRAVHEAGIQACVTMTPLLPLRDPEGFAAALIATGIQRFVVQPFHFTAKPGKRFVASTDERALQTTAALFQCPQPEATARYHRRYAQDLASLKEFIPQIETGRQGFAPPF